MFDHNRSGHPDKKSRDGFSVAELLIAVSLFGLLITIGFSGFKSFQHHTRTSNAIRTVTSAFNTARYRAIEHNNSIRVSLENSRLILKQKTGGEWEPYLDFQLPPGQAATMNASPVFYPTGYASPLCTVIIKNNRDEYRITISIAGRIKVIKVI
jgi:prepilin-type N-terminal cleavage/methylation domain-containing protein